MYLNDKEDNTRDLAELSDNRRDNRELLNISKSGNQYTVGPMSDSHIIMTNMPMEKDYNGPVEDENTEMIIDEKNVKRHGSSSNKLWIQMTS